MLRAGTLRLPGARARERSPVIVGEVERLPGAAHPSVFECALPARAVTSTTVSSRTTTSTAPLGVGRSSVPQPHDRPEAARGGGAWRFGLSPDSCGSRAVPVLFCYPEGRPRPAFPLALPSPFAPKADRGMWASQDVLELWDVCRSISSRPTTSMSCSTTTPKWASSSTCFPMMRAGRSRSLRRALVYGVRLAATSACVGAPVARSCGCTGTSRRA